MELRSILCIPLSNWAISKLDELKMSQRPRKPILTNATHPRWRGPMLFPELSFVRRKKKLVASVAAQASLAGPRRWHCPARRIR
jgi:hypothetical protein